LRDPFRCAACWALPSLWVSRSTFSRSDSFFALYTASVLVDHARWSYRQAALEYLLEAHMAHKQWPRALEFGGRLLAIDPLMEHVHRAVMRCHYFMGNRPAAVRQYAACVQLLRSELGVDPMEETTRIHETIIAVTPRPPDVTARRAAAPVGRAPRGRRAPLEEVNLAIANLDTARGWLVDVTDQLSEAAQRRPSGEGR